jgi:competence protein ComEC
VNSLAGSIIGFFARLKTFLKSIVTRLRSFDMFQKNHTHKPIWKRIRSRLWTLWLNYPMLAVLAICLVSVLMQEWHGDRWVRFLSVSLAGASILWGMAWLVRASTSPWLPFLNVAIAVGLFAGGLHGRSQRSAQERLIRWETALKEFSNQESRGTDPWRPLACRGIIDSSLRYRKATLLGGQVEGGEVGWQTLTTIRILETRSAGEWMPRSMLTPLTIDGKVTEYLPGDYVELYGQWKMPTRPSNPGQFDQAKRYAELGFAAQARADSESQLKRVGRPQLGRLDRWLAMVGARSLAAIERYVTLGQSELTAALVLGQREQAEWRLQEELLATGTIHMLSISGMHIEMVALSLLLLGHLLQIPRKLLLLGVCLIVIGYALLCGANPPVARAAMMLTGLCVARWMGWAFSSLNFLATAGVALMLYRTSVVFETGTQLSFMAVAVLILSTSSIAKETDPLQKLIESKWSSTRKSIFKLQFWCREMIRTSFWVWFVTAPLVWCSFHVVSPVAIVLNLLLWLPMLFALIAGLGLVAFGWFPAFAWPLGWVCGLSLWSVQAIVRLGEQVPMGHFWLRAPPSWWLYGFYALGIGVAAWNGVRRKASRRLLTGVLGAWFCLGLAINPARDAYAWLAGKSAVAKLSVTFVDVGHGTNIVIETPDHETWLYDAGRLGDHQRSYQVMVDSLWAMNRSCVDALILSHADSDHFNGIEGIAKRFAVRRLITTKQVYEHPSPLLHQNISAAQASGAQSIVWRNGDVYDGNGWSMMALHPPAEGVQGTDNANSLCVLLEFAGRRVLLPGDLEPPGMQMLTSQTPTDVDVLMAPHHGSMNAKSDSLLRWCRPELVVISGSHRASAARVLDSFSDSNRRVYVTARDHAIRVEIDATGRLRSYHWDKDRWMSLD